jgi:hypothetical protein
MGVFGEKDHESPGCMGDPYLGHIGIKLEILSRVITAVLYGTLGCGVPAYLVKT